MSCVDFITAFVINRLELRVLGYGITISPTQIALLDDELMPAFEVHYDQLLRVLDGFHLVGHDKVFVLF